MSVSTTYETPTTGAPAPDEGPRAPGLPARDLASGLLSRTTVAARHPIGWWLSVTWIGIVVFFVIFAAVLPLHDYDAIVAGLEPRAAPHFGVPEPLGTDVLGRSVTSRLVYGARQSLTIGLAATALAMLGGLTIGLVAGYFRGVVDTAIRIVLDAVLSIPALLLLVAVAAVGRRSSTSIVVALAVIGVPTFARLARATTLSLVDREHIVAARAMGARHHRIIVRELLPDVVVRLLSYAFLFLAAVIVVEASLSFLGLGVPPPQPSWGGMVDDGRPYLQSEAYLVFVPAACIVFTVSAFTVIGDRLRRRFDTTSLGER